MCSTLSMDREILSKRPTLLKPKLKSKLAHFVRFVLIGGWPCIHDGRCNIHEEVAVQGKAFATTEVG